MSSLQELSLAQRIELMLAAISTKKRQRNLLILSEYGLVFVTLITIALILVDFCVLYLLIMRVASDARVFAWPEFYLAMGLHLGLTIGFMAGCRFCLKHIVIKHKKIMQLKQELNDELAELKALKT